MKQPAIARLENEAVIPHLDALEKLAKALGLKIVLIDENAATSEVTIS
ncbi:hypothetical protein KK120_11775 [Virgibacillus dakarensis]|nr:hypothetical protein [Virgibacillus dakarensis]